MGFDLIGNADPHWICAFLENTAMPTAKKLRTNGLALTRKRTLILETMHGRHDHPDAEAVFGALRKRLPSLSLDTVYRTLNLFAEKGLIRQLAVPTHRFRFDGCLEPHDHFLCTQCEAVTDVRDVDAPPAPVPDALTEIGQVHARQQVFLGTCRRCAAARTAEPTGTAARRTGKTKRGE